MSTARRATRKRTAVAAAVFTSRTALSATGFGPPPPPPKPKVHNPKNHDKSGEINDDGRGARGPPRAGEEGGEKGQEQPFPELSNAKKVEEPRGIGTLFEREDELIRELSSDEYLDILRDWAPIASFASLEALDQTVRDEAASILSVLRGMAEWQPKRNADFTKLGSKWCFGAPVGAIKGGQVDALACLQVSEDDGVVIEWICGNPVTLGVPGNAVEWLSKGIHSLCGKRLDLPVTISRRARGGVDEGGDGDGDEKKKTADRSKGEVGGGSVGSGSKKRR